MPDQARLISAILALLPDNVKGEISPQDLRDTVLSLFPGYGGGYIFTDDFGGDINGVWTPVDSGLSPVGPMRDFDILAGPPNRLRYTGAPKRNVLVIANIGLSTIPSSAGIFLRVAKNNVGIDASAMTSTSGSNGWSQIVTFALVDLALNDTVSMELFTFSPVTVSVQSGHILAIALPALT